jgi:hypothetical protein
MNLFTLGEMILIMNRLSFIKLMLLTLFLKNSVRKSYSHTIQNNNNTTIKNDNFVTPEMFGALGYPHDDLLAFQKASNYCYTNGTKVLLLTKSKYYLGSYQPAMLNKALWSNVISESKIFHVAPGITIKSNLNKTSLVLNGGNSSPYGWNTAANVLLSPASDGRSEELTQVIAVNVDKNSIIISDPLHFTGSVKTRVSLFRIGKMADNIPGTPSMENAPIQFLHIKSIQGNEIFFEEKFIHSFQHVQNLYVGVCITVKNYPSENIFENIDFLADKGEPYVLVSRSVDIKCNNIGFYNVHFSFASMQKLQINKMFIHVNRYTSTFESCPDLNITDFYVDGGNTSNKDFDEHSNLGGMLINDHSINVVLTNGIFKNLKRTALSLLYGVDVKLKNIKFIDCGESYPDVKNFSAVITAGIPIYGAISDEKYAKSDTLKVNNIPNSTIFLQDISICGNSAIPIKFCDCAMVVKNMYVEINNSSPVSAVFFWGNTGVFRADPFNPNGGESSLSIDGLKVHKNYSNKSVSISNDTYDLGSIFGLKPLLIKSTDNFQDKLNDFLHQNKVSQKKKIKYYVNQNGLYNKLDLNYINSKVTQHSINKFNEIMQNGGTSLFIDITNENIFDIKNITTN